MDRADLLAQLGDRIRDEYEKGTLSQKMAHELCVLWARDDKALADSKRILDSAAKLAREIPIRMALPGSTPESVADWILKIAQEMQSQKAASGPRDRSQLPQSKKS